MTRRFWLEDVCSRPGPYRSFTLCICIWDSENIGRYLPFRKKQRNGTTTSLCSTGKLNLIRFWLSHVDYTSVLDKRHGYQFWNMWAFKPLPTKYEDTSIFWHGNHLKMPSRADFMYVPLGFTVFHAPKNIVFFTWLHIWIHSCLRIGYMYVYKYTQFDCPWVSSCMVIEEKTTAVTALLQGFLFSWPPTTSLPPDLSVSWLFIAWFSIFTTNSEFIFNRVNSIEMKHCLPWHSLTHVLHQTPIVCM